MKPQKLDTFEARTYELQQQFRETQERFKRTKCPEDVRELIRIQEQIDNIAFDVFFSEQ